MSDEAAESLKEYQDKLNIMAAEIDVIKSKDTIMDYDEKTILIEAKRKAMSLYQLTFGAMMASRALSS